MSETLPAGSDGVDRGGDERGLPLWQSLAAVRQRWWLVVGIVVLVAGTSFWRTVRQQRMYSAKATVRIQDQGNLTGITTPTYRDYRIDPIQSEQQVIRSEAVAERVVDDLGLQLAIVNPPRLARSVLFGSTPPVVDSTAAYQSLTIRLSPRMYSLVQGTTPLATAPYGSPVSGAGVSFTIPARPPIAESEVGLQVISPSSAAATVRGGVSTKSIPQTNIIEITYTGPDPATVRDITNAIASQYAAFSSAARRQQAQVRTKFIASSLAEQSGRVAAAADALKNFKEREQLTDVAAEQTALAQSIHGFEADRDALVAERDQYARLIGRLGAADTASEALKRLAGTDAVEKNNYIATLYTRWYDLVKQRETLLTQYTPANREVEAVDKLIGRTKEDLRSASGLYVQGLQSKIASLDATIANLREQTEKYPGLESRESRLMADLQSAQTVYDQLQLEYQRARIAESGNEGDVRIIDLAIQPTAPVSPNRRRVLLTALIFGLLLGLGAAIAVENLDDSVKSPDEIRERLGVAVLGTIPRMREPGGLRRRRERDERHLVTHVDPRSPVAEAYRALRTNIAFARAHEDLQAIVVSSPGPADGKSTTVANLAITFAQQGQRTLLIDADLRRPVLEKLFDAARSPGLTDVLVGTSTLAESARATEIPNLFFLASGGFPPNPSELLGSGAMERILREAKERYDIILLDSPPILAVTDAAVLSTLTDGTMLVVRVEETARAAIRRAVGQLRTVGGRVAGVVLNDVDFRRRAFTGSYGYYYHYYYGAESKRNGNGGVMGRVREWTGVGSGGHERR